MPTEIRESTYIEKPEIPKKPLKLAKKSNKRSLNNAKNASKGASNYSDAVDSDMSKGEEIIRNTLRYLKDNLWEGIPAGASNCTLTATSWIDPQHPISKAKTIITSPEQHGFIPASAATIQPGGLIISKVPGKDSYHTMLYSGNATSDYKDPRWGTLVKKGDKQVSYSSGGNEPENLRKDVPLAGYLKNSDGHTQLMYFNIK